MLVIDAGDGCLEIIARKTLIRTFFLFAGPVVDCGRDEDKAEKRKEKVEKSPSALVILELLASHPRQAAILFFIFDVSVHGAHNLNYCYLLHGCQRI